MAAADWPDLLTQLKKLNRRELNSKMLLLQSFSVWCDV